MKTGLMKMRYPSYESPVAIGGLGGSGTRLIAEIVQRLGIFTGDHLNRQNDNLFFTLLFKRPAWCKAFPPDDEVALAIDLFYRSMMHGLKSRVSWFEMKHIARIAHGSKGTMSSAARKRYVTALRLIRSTPPDLSRHNGWGWKEPNTHIFLPQLAFAFPTMKYVHVIRNGMDMAFSKNQQQADNWGDYVSGSGFILPPCTPQHSLEYWIAANRRAIEIGNERLQRSFYLLNYDDFCAAPGPGLEKLAMFLNIELPQEKLDAHKRLIVPRSIGRHHDMDLDIFSESQIQAVRDLGFSVGGP